MARPHPAAQPMRRNNLYNIETKLRSCVPPPAFKSPRVRQWWERCAEDSDDDGTASDTDEPNNTARWSEEKVRGRAVIARIAQDDDCPLFDRLGNDYLPTFYPLWGLGADPETGQEERNERLGAVVRPRRDSNAPANSGDVGRHFITDRELANVDAGQPERLAICMPCYNEEWREIEATTRGICHMVKTINDIAMHNGKPCLRAVIVIIQDGISNAHPTFRRKIQECKYREAPSPAEEAEDITDDMQWTSYLTHTAGIGRNGREAAVDASSGGGGRAAGRTAQAVPLHLPYDNTQLSRHDEIAFVMHHNASHDVQAGVVSRLYVIKGANRRKHDSHGWFFRICRDLKPEYIMMTDTGTLFDGMCLSRLVDALHQDPTLMGVTARQRVMNSTRLAEIHGHCSPLRWWLSPAPLQGFEFEATFILNTALFNIVRALPVLPGPCQVLRWEPFEQQVAQWYMDRMKADVRNDSLTVVLTRLAEDRVMSTGCVTNGTYGTKWVPGATFYYEPELKFQTLLPQRRRWINGTNASFDFLSDAGVNTINYSVERTLKSLWSMMRWQTFVLKFSAAAFACAFFESFTELFTQPYSIFSPAAGCNFKTIVSAFGGELDCMVPQYSDTLGPFTPPPSPAYNPAAPPTPPPSIAMPNSHLTCIFDETHNETKHWRCDIEDPAFAWCKEAWVKSSPQGDVPDVPGTLASCDGDKWCGNVNKRDVPACQPQLACCEPYPYLSAIFVTAFFLVHVLWVVWSHTHVPKRGASLGTMCLCGRPGRHTWMWSEAFCILVWLVHIFFMGALLLAIGQGMAHAWSVLYTLVVLIFLVPPVMTIGQSISSTVAYFMYFVPFMFSLSFYVSGVFTYAFARLHDSSWGNRGGGAQDRDVVRKRQSEFKLLSTMTTTLWLLVNTIVFAGYIAIKYQYGNESGLTYFLVAFIFLPVVPQMMGSVFYMLYLLTTGCRNFGRATEPQERDAWGTGAMRYEDYARIRVPNSALGQRGPDNEDGTQTRSITITRTQQGSETFEGTLDATGTTELTVPLNLPGRQRRPWWRR